MKKRTASLFFTGLFMSALSMAQSPVITSFVPASGPVGTTVMITGSNFNGFAANNIVFFGATQAAVTSSSTTQLVVTVPSGATYQPISVLNIKTELSGYSSSPFILTGGPNQGQPFTANSFEVPVNFVTGPFPVAVASGDLDSDGKPDLVVANASPGQNPASISIYHNTTSAGSISASSFAAKIDIATIPSPGSITISDLDGDGKPELVVTSSISGSGRISIFRNTSTAGSITASSFAPAVSFHSIYIPRVVAIGDVDGDGKPDMAAACGSVVLVYRNISSPGTITSASFAAAVLFNTGFLNSNGIAIGDLDGDNKPDLVTANGQANFVSIFRNTAVPNSITTASFDPKVDFATGSGPHTVAIGDLDGDGKPDLATGNRQGNSISVLRNTASSGTIDAGSFAVNVDFATGLDPNSVIIADMNGDGKSDLASGNSTSRSVSVLRNVAAAGTIDLASFSPRVDFASGQSLSLAISDLDGDGAPDIAAANYSSKINGNHFISVFHNVMDVTPPAVPTGLTAVAAHESVVLNWSPNTESDLASYKIYEDTGTDLVLIGTVAAPATTFTHTGLTNGVSHTYRISAVDLAGNESAKTAAVTAVTLPPVITSFTPSSGPVGTTVIITGNNFNNTANNNIAFFGATRAAVTSASPTQLVVTVPSGATYQPISVLNSITALTGYSSKPFVLTGGPNQGQAFTTNSFEAPVYFTGGSFPRAIASGDLDGDGNPDLAVANYSVGLNPASISVYRNTTSIGSITASSFAGRVDFPVEANPGTITIGDLDGDGKPDLIVTSHFGTISVFRNTSTPGSITSSSFAPRINFPLGSTPRGSAIGDLDGDGKQEMVAACESVVKVFRNISSPGTITSASFAAPVSFDVGFISAQAVAIGDLDGDNKPDLVTANNQGGSVSVFRNTSVPNAITSSSFAPKVDFAVGFYPESVAIGDLDGNSKPDLAVGKRALGALGVNTIAVLRNTASSGTIDAGSFAASVDFVTGVTSYSVTIADMNGDGKSDLVAGNGDSGGGSVSVLRNVALTGVIDVNSFSSHVLFGGDQSVSLAVSDLDGDGAPDIAAANYGSNVNGNFVISVFHNAMDVTPPAVPTGLTATAAYESVILNWSPNTESDLASYKIYQDTGTDLVLIGTVAAPATTFTHTGLINGVFRTYRIAAVDLTGNESAKTAPVTAITLPPVITSFTPSSGPVGTTVIITGNNFNNTANNNVVFFGATRAAVTSASPTQLVVTVPSGATYQPISVLNSITTLTGYSSQPFILTGGPNQGQAFTTNSFEAPVYFTGGSFPRAIASGDLDGDGNPDLAVANYSVGLNPASISVYRNTTSIGSITASSFAGRVDFPVEANPGTIAIGDLDGDGKPDLIVTSHFGTISVFRNTSTPGSITSSSFAPRINFPLGSTPRGSAIGDLDGDGKPEMVAACESVVKVLRNISSPGTITSASFAAPVSFNVGFISAQAVAIGDLDGDNKPDLVTANNQGGSVSVFRNTSVPNAITSSSFAPKVDFAVGFYPESVAIGDLDGNSKPDLAVGKRALGALGVNTIAVLRNTASSGTIDAGSFAASVDFVTGVTSYSVTIADMNGDGKSDLVAGNGDSGGGSVSVLRNVASTGVIDVNSFSSHVLFGGDQSVSLAVSDLDGDGAPDIAVANYGKKVNGNFVISVFHNDMDITSLVAAIPQEEDPSPGGGEEFRKRKPETADASTSETEESEIKLFPNPSTGRLFITLPTSSDASVTLLDNNGRVIKQNQYQGTPQVIMDLDNVSKGLHLIKIRQENRVKNIRVVIE